MKKEIKITNNELFYNGYSLTSLAKKYGTPLRLSFLGVILLNRTARTDPPVDLQASQVPGRGG